MFTIPRIIKYIFPSIIWNHNSAKKSVFLTFDDGPMQGITSWVLSQLKTYEAKATFFVVGENVERYPELVNSIEEEGHSIGNHTMNHVNGWKLSKTTYLENIKDCEKALLSQKIDSHLFRPPYGRLNPLLINRIQKKYKIVMWDLLSKDYSPKHSPELLLEKLIKFTKSGSVVVFHDSLKAEKNLRFILPHYLEFLNKKGFSMESIPN